MSIEVQKRIVTIRLLEDLLGSSPKDKNLYSSYIETKKPIELEDDVEVTNVSVEEKGWTGFLCDQNGLFIYNYIIKGFLKNAALALKEQHGVKQARSKIVNHVFVSPRKLYFNKHQPDGVCERPIQCQTLQGPRTSLARSDVIAAGTEITFNLEWLTTAEVKEALLKDILEFGKYCGLGQFRTGGYGAFEVLSFVNPDGGEEKEIEKPAPKKRGPKTKESKES